MLRDKTEWSDCSVNEFHQYWSTILTTSMTNLAVVVTQTTSEF